MGREKKVDFFSIEKKCESSYKFPTAARCLFAENFVYDQKKTCQCFALNLGKSNKQLENKKMFRFGFENIFFFFGSKKSHERITGANLI